MGQKYDEKHLQLQQMPTDEQGICFKSFLTKMV